MMRLRFGLVASLLAASMMFSGCGKAEKPAPPPGADTETPTVNIDEGSIPAPGEGGDAADESGDETDTNGAGE